MSCVTVNHVWDHTLYVCITTGSRYLLRQHFVHFTCNEPSACVVTYAQQLCTFLSYCTPRLFCSYTVCVALDHLQEAHLITGEELQAGFSQEHGRLTNFSDVVVVQSRKHHEVVKSTAGILRKIGFENVSQDLEGDFSMYLRWCCSFMFMLFSVSVIAQTK